MKSFFRPFLLVVVLLCAVAAQAADQTPKVQRVYIFGVATSLTDHRTCITPVQELDSAWVDSHKMLCERALYSLQLQYYMENIHHVSNPVCAVVFAKSQKRAERMWRAVQKKQAKLSDMQVELLEATQFTFTPEAWQPPVMLDDAVPAAPAPADMHQPAPAAADADAQGGTSYQ